jgi:hypothetical protein
MKYQAWQARRGGVLHGTWRHIVTSSGMAGGTCSGMAGPGALGEAGQRRGMGGLGLGRHGRRGVTGRFSGGVRYGQAWRIKAWSGEAGKAWPGLTQRGVAGPEGG